MATREPRPRPRLKNGRNFRAGDIAISIEVETLEYICDPLLDHRLMNSKRFFLADCPIIIRVESGLGVVQLARKKLGHDLITTRRGQGYSIEE